MNHLPHSAHGGKMVPSLEDTKMKPDAKTFRTYMRQLDADDNQYVRCLVDKLVRNGMEVQDIAMHIGLTPRMLRMYRQEVNPCKPPYPVIYTLQRLVEA